MKVAVLSDVHGNLPALEAVMAATDEAGVDARWCLGDVVGYGARPSECVDLVRARCDVVLAGNHDLAAAAVVGIGRFSGDAARAIRWTREVLDPPREAWLGGLEPRGQQGRIGLYHGSPRDPVWEYVLDAVTAREALERAPHDVILVGHTHQAIAVALNGTQLTGGRAREGMVVDVVEGLRLLLNPGSVGQPRDGDPRAAWLELELREDVPVRAAYRRVAYDVARAQGDILAAGLPDHLADRLLFGM